MWIHSGIVGAQSVTPKFVRIVGLALEQEEKLCNKVETLREFTYLGYRLNTDIRCDAAVTARI